MAKRKNETPANGKAKKKRAISDDEAQKNFRDGLFNSQVLEGYTNYYVDSQPYKHAVIQNLVNDTLLRNVRNEIREHIHFTPKETDIYKIHQSGDLANLDGLHDSALKRLPSLLTLRDSLYSSAFRKYLSSITKSGPLSGVKTDMAVVGCAINIAICCANCGAECIYTRLPPAVSRRRDWKPARELDSVPVGS
ncbi:fe ii 2-oxoglutarate-dependent dioxygenase [Pyrenophora tritici-repentis]|nr:fe ii 2-oxoglutarate-dependent dioxygenase [Pyrenophora tritici-repentis]KAG9381891.1 fe ii 2-oxoglutarate-dependent dioxygenase [Pyrenophora tritici-repentis]